MTHRNTMPRLTSGRCSCRHPEVEGSGWGLPSPFVRCLGSDPIGQERTSATAQQGGREAAWPGWQLALIGMGAEKTAEELTC